MNVLGDLPEPSNFLQRLDPEKLVDLGRDMLVRRGHAQLKITDGPGDGCRDIHSVDGNGERHLTQAKFNGNTSEAVSSREIGDLAVGLLKFGYRKGLFLTNARISPQAKRECLDNFPGYSIDFIEGRELVSVVFSDLVLKALWYDGESLDRVSYAVVVPAVLRDLEKDRPLTIFPDGQERDGSTQDITLETGQTRVKVSLQPGTANHSSFGTYRAASVRTMSESGFTGIRSADAILSGVIHLEDMDNLLLGTAGKLLQHARALYGSAKTHVAVRVGRPYLAPLGGVASGARIELTGNSPFTLVQHGDLICSEEEWVCPSEESQWHLPDRVTAMTADWIRWYNPRIDACLDLTILSSASELTKALIEEEREYFLKWWNSSLFVLLPRSAQRHWLVMNLPEPTLSVAWETDQLLCCWLHGNLAPGPRPMLIEPDEGQEHMSPFQVDPTQAQEGFARLRQQVHQLGGTFVEPSKARYMVAAVQGDPVPNSEMVRYRSVDLAMRGMVPSPIDPSGRSFRFTAVWELDPFAAPGSPQPNAEEVVSKILEQSSPSVKARVDLDDRLSEHLYLQLHIENKDRIGMERTDELLERFEPFVLGLIEETEAALAQQFPGARRATKSYWFHTAGVMF